MGFIALEFDIVNHYVDYYKKIYNKQYEDIQMLELGDQIFYVDHPSVGVLNSNNFKYKVAKDYFQNKKINHTSIDLNGNNGSISLDLSKSLPEEFYNKFDIITNVGTVEHVEEDQYETFKNIHKCLKVNGMFMSFMPKVGSFDINHCSWFYNLDFYRDLANEQKYTIFYLGEILYPSINRDMGTLVTCVLQKTENNDFIINKDIFHRNLFRK